MFTHVPKVWLNTVLYIGNLLSLYSYLKMISKKLLFAVFIKENHSMDTHPIIMYIFYSRPNVDPTNRKPQVCKSQESNDCKSYATQLITAWRASSGFLWTIQLFSWCKSTMAEVVKRKTKLSNYFKFLHKCNSAIIYLKSASIKAYWKYI